MDSLKEAVRKVKESLRIGLETARSKGIIRKSLLGFAAIIAIVAVLIVFLKAMGILFDSIYRFVDRHFFGLAASWAGGSYLMCSCDRPIRVEDMGSPSLDSYIRSGIIYLRYALPKVCVEPLDVTMVKSVLQGLVDQKIRTRGLPPLISVGDDHFLYVDKVEDMKTYIHVTFALDYSDSYIQKIAYDNAMAEVLGRSGNNSVLRDRDYD